MLDCLPRALDAAQARVFGEEDGCLDSFSAQESFSFSIRSFERDDFNVRTVHVDGV